MDKSIDVYEDWYVIFTSSVLDHPVMKWLDPHHQHCYAVKESPGGEFWIIVDSKNSHLDIRLESKINYPHIRVLCPGCTIISIRAKINPDIHRGTLCVFTCVEVCKSLLGIKSRWVLTPYQLYKRLTR